MAESTDSGSLVDKVIIHLRATGDAPLLKQDKVKVSGTERFATVVDFLRKQLQRDSVVSE